MELNNSQITWGGINELDRPLKIEQPEVHHEIPPQGIVTAQPEGDNSQILAPQPEIETNIIHLVENQIMQEGISNRKRQRIISILETSSVKRRKDKETTQPESNQETIQT